MPSALLTTYLKVVHLFSSSKFSVLSAIKLLYRTMSLLLTSASLYLLKCKGSLVFFFPFVKSNLIELSCSHFTIILLSSRRKASKEIFLIQALLMEQLYNIQLT